MSDLRFVRLGASLYVPGTRDDLVSIAVGERHPGLRSVIFCTEDAIHEREVERALANLERALEEFRPAAMLRFVRARNPAVLERLLDMKHIDRIDGFVLPKVTAENLEPWLAGFRPGQDFDLMLTLETREAFDPLEMRSLRVALCAHPLRERVLSIRIGGNDLLNLLGMRRDPARTIYQTALRHTIAQLATVFKPWGFNLTGPVNDCLDNAAVLAEEVDLDLQHGLFGKTAIHPRQIAVIEARYRVSPRELEHAESILRDNAPAVFRIGDRMCEPATHHQWARLIVERAAVYGVSEPPSC